MGHPHVIASGAHELLSVKKGYTNCIPKIQYAICVF